jgi:hypothetical protein
MTRITGSDQVLLLLRERLQRMDRGRTGATARAGRTAGPGTDGASRLQALAGARALAPDEFKRALLTEELGDAVAHDPAFQAIADDVYRVISQSDEGRELIERASSALRAKG